VVTPSFNQAPFLEESMRSVLLQEYPDLEYIVLDGGSDDGSPVLIASYAPWLAFWRSAPDGGQSQAINEGFGRATGDILAWLNSDDLYLPGTLAAVAEAFAATPEAVLIYGQAELIDRDGAYLRPYDHVRPYDRRWLLEEDNLIAQPAAFFRRDAFFAAGGLDESLHYAMDFDLWLRLGHQGPAICLPQTLARMRSYPEAKTESGDRALFAEVGRVVGRAGGRGLPARYQQWLGTLHLRQALAAFSSGRPEEGREELAYLLENAPVWSGDNRRLGEAIAAHAWRQAAGRRDEATVLPFVELVTGHWPAAAAAGPIRRTALARLYQALAFQAHRGRQGRAVRRSIWRAFRHDRHTLVNRGLWAILLDSFRP
jgi:hypothetical protein